MEFNLILHVRHVHVDPYTCTENNVENKVIFNIRRHRNEVRTVTAGDGDPIPASLKFLLNYRGAIKQRGVSSSLIEAFAPENVLFLVDPPPPPKQYTVILYTLILTRFEPSNDICLTRRTTPSRYFNICNPFIDFIGFVNISCICIGLF